MAKAPTAETPAAAGTGRLKLIVVAALALLLAAGLSAAGTWFFLGKERPAEAQATSARPQAVSKQPAVYEELMPPFVVNFQAGGRTRYMQASLALMGRDAGQLAELKAHMPALRNQLVMLFSSQDFEALNAPLGLDMLKQKVTATVQQLAMQEVGAPVVEQVLFTNFVMQ